MDSRINGARANGVAGRLVTARSPATEVGSGSGTAAEANGGNRSTTGEASAHALQHTSGSPSHSFTRRLLQHLLLRGNHRPHAMQGEATLHEAKQMKECQKRIDECMRQRLPVLNLSSLGLTALPAELEQLTHLRILAFDNNRLEKIPGWVTQLANVESLSLAGNHLTEIPAELAYLTKLSYLNLSGNRLTDLPASVGNLSCLQNLNLSHNQFSVFPESVSRLSSLTKLSLSFNYLESLPEEIRLLKNLYLLDLSRNLLKALPETMGDLTSLEFLQLGSNRLRSLPSTIDRLHKLNLLDIEGNDIFFRPDHFPRNFSSPNQLMQLPSIEETVKQANQAVISLDPPKKAQILCEYALEKLRLGELEWALQGNSLINQLLVYHYPNQELVYHYPNQELVDKAIRKQLGDAYTEIEAIKALKNFAHQHYLYDADEHLIFMSAEPSQALIISYDFYLKNILNRVVDDDSSTHWNNFSLFRKNPVTHTFEIQIADKIGDLRQIFQAYPLFLRMYERAHLSSRVMPFLEMLNPFTNLTEPLDDKQEALNIKYKKYISFFKHALTVCHYENADTSKRLTNYEDQAALWQMFAPVFAVPERESIALDDKISEPHFHAIMHAFETSKADATVQAATLSALACVFIRYSSASLLGREAWDANAGEEMENLSPAALRRYALGLLNKAEQLCPGFLPDWERYRSFIMGPHCGSLLYGGLRVEIKGRYANQLEVSKIFEAIIPKAWQ